MDGPSDHTSSVPDKLDRLILHAVRAECRASFALIAEVVGASEQTVARRYRRMEADGVLRVMGLPSATGNGLDRWVLRIQCRPDAAAPLADALAKRNDVNWVSLSAGGSEVVCSSQTTPGVSGHELLLQRLPRTAQVQGLSAHSVLHEFDVDAEWGAYGPGLSEAAQYRLRNGATPAVDDGPVRRLNSDDGPLLEALRRDGRATLRTLAGITGWSPNRVSRRIDQLRASGELYFDVDLDIGGLGFSSMSYIWVTVAPSDLEAVGNELVNHEEVAFCAAVTGSANLVLVVICRDSADLYRYVTTRIGAITAVRQIETSPVLRRVKQAGSLVGRGQIAPRIG